MTVVASLARRVPAIVQERERWELSDGDFLDVDRTPGPSPEAPIAVVCHGLEGSSRATYVVGVASRLRAKGLAVIAINFRGCSGEPNRLPRFYHSGETGDLGHVIDRLREERPGRPIGLVGFSLGGNVVAKYLGEQGDRAPEEVRAGAVISAPFDLAGCCAALDGEGLAALVYRERFLRTLRPKALAKARRFPGLVDASRVERARTIRAYDDAVTAPIHGFSSAEDYYARSSSGRFVANVRRPLVVISAEDDPFVPGATLPRATLSANAWITAAISREGGHIGFLEGSPWGVRRFAEDRAAAFVAAHVARAAGR